MEPEIVLLHRLADRQEEIVNEIESAHIEILTLNSEVEILDDVILVWQKVARLEELDLKMIELRKDLEDTSAELEALMYSIALED